MASVEAHCHVEEDEANIDTESPLPVDEGQTAVDGWRALLPQRALLTVTHRSTRGGETRRKIRVPGSGLPMTGFISVLLVVLRVAALHAASRRKGS